MQSTSHVEGSFRSMVRFRRSLKSEKTDSKPHSFILSHKDETAILPPKKVIKALYDYQAPDDRTTRYLSFSAGDFLHVVGRENDTDWYEACNPLIGSRGLVPAAYFDAVGRKVLRQSGSSFASENPNAPHDSGYAERATIPGGSPTSDSKNIRLSKINRTGAMVYGMVMYDFKAERPDELEAREGEAIIVIAQSNPEWFVAKPITRLGGPGLIPASFIEIRDMVTGKPVPNPQEAIHRAGVPKVEEWKKMAAEYKNGSIPLGKIYSHQSQSIGQSMERLSLDNSGASAANQNYAPTVSSAKDMSPFDASHASRSSVQQLLAPVEASVPRYCFAEDNFWFIVEAVMEDGRSWELSRYYKDFYDLQINLIQEYPLEAGNVKGYERSLPYMPGPVTYVTDNISNGRRTNLDEYIKNLLKLGPHITSGFLVRRFFAPREGDFEMNGDMAAYRHSINSAVSAKRWHDQPSTRSSAAHAYGHNGEQRPLTQGRSSNDYGHHSSSQHNTNNYDYHNAYADPSSFNGYHNDMNQSASSQLSSGPLAIKIKCWFDNNDCVVLRMPSFFRYSELSKKIFERHQLEQGLGNGDDGSGVSHFNEADMQINYKHTETNDYYPIANDDDLRNAMEQCSKLVLTVSFATRY